MTLASEVIRRAYREAQIVSISASPTAAEQAEALALLNTTIMSVFGSEVGRELTDLQIGGQYDQSNRISNAVPDDTRLVISLGAAMTVYLDPLPYEGQRVAVADAGANFATYNLTVSGNGRQIEAASTVTLSTSGVARQWMYRADTANWVRLTDLTASNEMPFPSEFDDYFVITLALRLNPRNRSDGMARESIAALERQEGQLRARYRKPRRLQDWGSLGLLGQRDRNLGGELL